MKQLKFFLAFCLILFLGTIEAQQDLYEGKEFIKGNDTLKYRMLLPKDFSEEKQYPIVLFLHGAGERGNDNKKQLVHGSKLFLNQMNRGAFPAIVIFPQCPRNSYWSNAKVDRTTKPISLVYPLNEPPTKALDLVIQLMEEYVGKPYVDNNKIYVGGLSMGGMGTFEILNRKPNMFAAAFAICGGGNPHGVKEYANKTELWVFHGAKDDVVNPQLSVSMVNAYLEAGGKPNFSLYANDNHNSWDSAFAEPNLLPWLFSKSKK
ncbi:prolyl oligopeptidase family serine peptidase [Flavivirga sp. 57AJ16]|uniref:carboxylesterase family protein n=1 Tax=Flavivirga sp. 57AJ16 TaxID=3025307 RepID=UPI0023669614|nr:prolyl oligopeptidase family serine peptidase [Flavivirga sp. 57AJ16]MDD7887534.1 prolyl oligopeptidase family serine peptidase [Flavivirga sp. 57AJ16]